MTKQFTPYLKLKAFNYYNKINNYVKVISKYRKIISKFTIED